MSTIRALAGQTALYGLSSIIGRFLNYLLVPLYTRVFDPEAYGVVSEFYAYATFLLVLFTYGTETALFHFSRKADAKSDIYKKIFSIICISAATMAALLIIFSTPLARFTGHESHPEYIVWIALILMFDAISAIPFAQLRLADRAKSFVALKLLNILLNIGLNLFFLVFARELYEKGTEAGKALYDPKIGAGYVFISNLIASGITLVFFLRSFRYFEFRIDMAFLKKMLNYSLPLMIAGFAGMINETLDRAVYKYLAPDQGKAMHELGIYSACYKVAMIMTLFIQTFRYASEPFFFSQQHKDKSRSMNAIVMNYFVAVCCIIFLTVVLYLDLFMYFVGEEYREGYMVVPILLLANLFLGVYIYLSLWYKLSGETQFGAFFAMAGAVITILLLVLLVPVYGYMGAAWATLLCYGSIMVLSYITGQKHYPIPYDLKAMLILLVSSLIVWIGVKIVVDYISSFWLRETLRIAVLLIYIGTAWIIVRKSNNKIAINTADAKS